MTLSYPDTNELTKRIIAAAIEVHRYLGPGLLESIYEECLYLELSDAGLPLDRQRAVPIIYKNRSVNAFYRPDLIVRDTVIVEVKSVEKLIPVHEAQVLTYLKVTGLKVGLLFNFNTPMLADGIKRLSL